MSRAIGALVTEVAIISPPTPPHSRQLTGIVFLACFLVLKKLVNMTSLLD